MKCRKLLTDSNIEKVSFADAAIENLWKTLARGQAVDMIAERIEKRMREAAFPLRIGNAFYVLFHPVGAGLFIHTHPDQSRPV